MEDGFDIRNLDWDSILSDAEGLLVSQPHHQPRFERAVQGKSTADHIHAVAEEILDGSHDIEIQDDESFEEAIIKAIVMMVKKKTHANYKNCADRAKFNDVLIPFSIESDPLLARNLLAACQTDEDAYGVVIAVLDEMNDFQDSQGLAETLEIDISKVEAAKKRVKRIVKKIFEHLPEFESGQEYKE